MSPTRMSLECPNGHAPVQVNVEAPEGAEKLSPAAQARLEVCASH